MRARSFARWLSSTFTTCFPGSEICRSAHYVIFQVMFTAFKVRVLIGVDGYRLFCSYSNAWLIGYFFDCVLIGYTNFMRHFYVIRRCFFCFRSQFVNYVCLYVIVILFPIVPVFPCMMSQATNGVDVQSMFLPFSYMLYATLRIKGPSCWQDAPILSQRTFRTRSQVAT